MSDTAESDFGGRAFAPPSSVTSVNADSDDIARRIAYVTVGLPAVGFVGALVFAAMYGITATQIGLLMGLYALTVLGVEVGLHRFFSHRAFSAGAVVTSFLGVAGCMAAQGPILFWAATHRMHHAFTDRDGDPHSPRPIGEGRFAGLRGFWHGHVGWLFTLNRKNWSAYVPDLLKDRLIVKINQLYLWWILLGLAVPTLVGWWLDGGARGAIGGLLWGGLARIFLLDQATWSVNSIAHIFGSRPNSTRDNSRNVAWMAFHSIGGAWHNNHHAYPALAHNDLKPWQLDIGAWFLRALEALGLVWDVRRYKAKERAHMADPGTQRVKETRL